MTDPNSQGGAVWRGDPDDGKYKTGLDRIADAMDACPKCAEYREALEAVRWRNEYGGFSACAVCGWRKTYEERHSPTCKIGRLFAGKREEE